MISGSILEERDFMICYDQFDLPYREKHNLDGIKFSIDRINEEYCMRLSKTEQLLKQKERTHVMQSKS